MTRIFYTLLFLFLFCSSEAQKHKRFTYFGIETGAKKPIFGISDAGVELYTKSSFSFGQQGVTIEQELDYVWSVSSGIFFSKQGIDYRFRRDGAYSTPEPMRLIQIPVQIRANIPVTYGTPEIRLVPLLGAHLTINQTNGNKEIKGRIPPNLADTYNGSIRTDFQKVFVLAEGGMNLDLMFAQGLILSVGSSYYKGFSKIMQTDLTYNISKEPFRGSVTSKGDNIGIRLALKYPVSRFWRKGFPTKKEKEKKKKKDEK
jgi:hypothetical protein